MSRSLLARELISPIVLRGRENGCRPYGTRVDFRVHPALPCRAFTYRCYAAGQPRAAVPTKVFSCLVVVSLLAGIAAAQNSPPTVYAESYRKGPTRITEDKFELKLTSASPEYKQRLRDSSGAERYQLIITPKIGEGEGNDKITSWLVGLYDLRHTIYGNLLQFDQESSEQPRDNLYWLNPVQSAPVPILARRIIKVEGFYVVFQVKGFHYSPPDTGYVDSMTVQWEFSNRDPRPEVENR